MIKFQDNITHINAVDDTRETFFSLRLRSIWVAEALQRRHLGAGDVITICARNSADTFATSLGGIFLGCPINVLPVGMDKGGFSHILNLIKPKLIFCEENDLAVMESAVKDVKLTTEIILYTDKENQRGSFKDFQVDNGTDKNFAPVPVQDVNTTTALIICSSGTTGLPKGVQISHETVLRHTILHNNLAEQNEVVLMNTALFWTTGWMLFMSGIFYGACRIFYTNPFNEQHVLESIEKYKVNKTVASPSVLNRLVGYEEISKYDLSSLEVVMVTGGIAAPAAVAALGGLIPGGKVQICFGMTELGAIVTLNDGDGHHDSVGKLLKGVCLKIVDLETGDALGPNQEGEVYWKHDCIMLGYVNNPKSYAETVDKEGWLHSGDLGYYDDDQFVYIIGRRKEMLKFQNFPICPAEIENILIAHPCVMDAVVVGVPHDIYGDLLVAFVMRNDGDNVSEEELKKFVADQVADWKKIRGGIIFVEKMRLLPSMKIDKSYYRKLVSEMRQTLLANAD